MVAVFAFQSDDSVKLDQSESFEASFHTREEVGVIAELETAAPWLRSGWRLLMENASQGTR